MLPPEVYSSIVHHAPVVAIDLIVRNGRDEMLMGLRKNRPAQSFWLVPGGRIAKGERIADGFGRISLAELGVRKRIEDATFLGVFDHLYDDNFHGDPSFGTHYVALGFSMQAEEAALRLPVEPHDLYLWLGNSDILEREDVHESTKAYARVSSGRT